MCEVTDACERKSKFWVQSRREILNPGNPDVGVEPFKSGVNITACRVHLARAVDEIGDLNREAANGVHLPATDGVIVKTRTTTGAWQ